MLLVYGNVISCSSSLVPVACVYHASYCNSFFFVILSDEILTEHLNLSTVQFIYFMGTSFCYIHMSYSLMADS
jgi:hypothetical protein